MLGTCLPEPVKVAQPRQQKRRCLAPTAAELDYLPEFLDRHAAPRRRTPSRWPTLSSGRGRRGEQRWQSKPTGRLVLTFQSGAALRWQSKPTGRLVLTFQSGAALHGHSAKLRAVKRRAERALQHIERCTDELAAHHTGLRWLGVEEQARQDHPRQLLHATLSLHMFMYFALPVRCY